MIKFDSIYDGVNHIECCPLCHINLSIDDHEVSLSGETITFEMGTGLISANIKTGFMNKTVHTVHRAPPGHIINTRQGPIITVTPNHQQPIPTSGLCIVKLGVSCDHCGRYGYTLQVHFDMNKREVSGVFFNSEILTVDTMNVTYEIRNIYATEKTIFRTFAADRDDTIDIELPLIPLNRDAPKETIDRIKNLIVFS